MQLLYASVFQFSNPMLLKLDFALNDEFVGDGRTEIKVKLGIETRISREEDNSAVVVLCVTVGGKSQEDPFSIYAEEGARFGWKEGAYSGDDLLDMDYFLNEDDLFDDETGVEGFYIF